MAAKAKELPARSPASRKAINIRVPMKDLALIDRAAVLAHKDRTEFILGAVVDRAEEVLLDQTSFVLSEDAFAAFVEALDNPPTPSPELVALMRRKPSWEH